MLLELFLLPLTPSIMKIVDQIYRCQLPGQVSGVWQLQCHLRIFQPYHGVQTVMVTDMAFEMGWFIPALVEKLIEQVVNEFHLDPAKLIWIEHYSPELREITSSHVSQVTFDWHNGQATNLQWTEIAPETIQAFMSEASISAYEMR